MLAESHGIYGSPPRLRGILQQGRLPSDIFRFTPAPAGNTASMTLIPLYPPVHPRACGEYARSRTLGPFFIGSPPRLRGIRQARQEVAHEERFTPAPAGNTDGRAS